MKRLIILSLMSFLMVAANGQEIFRKGTNIVNLGIGLGSGIPIEASYERSLVEGLINDENGAIGFGGYFGWHLQSNVVIGARGAFHNQFVENLDTYAGLMLGYNIDSALVGSASFSAFLGARYYFTPKIGAYAEVGYGIAYMCAGVSLKF
jgi:hypothetical protein